MPTNQKKKQKALEKQKAKRKQKQKLVHTGQTSLVSGPPHAVFKAAANWPLRECLISRDWQNPGEIVQAVVARQSEQSGKVAVATFLIDLGCLGVKNANLVIEPSWGSYLSEVRERMTERQAMAQTDLDTLAKIIREAIAYAASLGFKPHRDYAEAAQMLAGSDPAASPVEVTPGKDGRPFFIAGPYDNVAQIIAKLDKAVGLGNYDFLAPIGDPGDLLDDLDDPDYYDDADLEDDEDDPNIIEMEAVSKPR